VLNHLDVRGRLAGVEPPPRPEVDQAASRTGRELNSDLPSSGLYIHRAIRKGSLCLWIPGENTLIAGDTLFRDSIRRTDLPGGDGRKILHSRSKPGCCWIFPGDAVVIPGHGPRTTIGREKERNPSYHQNL